MSMAASLPNVGGYSSAASSLYPKRGMTNILDRPLNKTRGVEVNFCSMPKLFLMTTH